MGLYIYPESEAECSVSVTSHDVFRMRTIVEPLEECITTHNENYDV